MPNRMVEKARQQGVFLQRTRRLSGVSSRRHLHHLGLSYRRIEPLVDSSHKAIRNWYHRLKYFFEPDCQDRQGVAVDFHFRLIDGEEHYVWAAVDCDFLEVLAVDVSLGRSSLDALLFLKDILDRCCGRPLVRADHGLW